MKRLLIFLFGICCYTASAQQTPVTLTFSDPLQQESEFVRTVAELQSNLALETVVSGKIAGRQYTVDIVWLTDGKEERLTTPPYTCKSDSLRFFIVSQAIGADSVRISIPVPLGLKNGFRVAGANSCILMEPHPETALTTGESIPIAAFTHGKLLRFEMPDGKGLTGEHYCAVRDAKLHPSKWHERFGLTDYIYFEIRFTEP